MSEFLAEARILVRPDTTKFRALLETELAAVTAKPIVVPITPVVAGAGLAGAAAETGAFTAAQKAAAAGAGEASAALQAEAAATEQVAVSSVRAAVSTDALNAALKAETVGATDAAVAQGAHARSINQLARGAGASGLSLFGLRGATLAASGAFLAGTAAVVGFSKAVQSAASLQTELNVFKVTAGATADEMVRVSTAAKDLGRDLTLPGVTASDAATAMTELAKAGLSVKNSLAAARGTLQLATAAQIDNAEAAKLISGALNSFQLSGTQATHVADLFAGAAKSAQGSIQDFGPALAQASAVAHGFGVSIEDTFTLLTQLAKAGLEGGRAGTSLRVAFLRLVNPTAAAAKELKNLKVQVTDLSTGAVRPQVFTDIQNALKGVGVEERRTALATIFGSDAIRTQIILGQQGAAAFEQIGAAVNKAGTVQEQAAARTKGFQGSVENLSNQVSTLGTDLGALTLGPLQGFVTSLAETAGAIDKVITGFESLRKELGKKFEFKIPGTDQTGNSLGDKILKGLFLTGPGFIKLASNTLNETVIKVVKDARDKAGQEERIAKLVQEGGAFGLTGLVPGIVALIDKLPTKAAGGAGAAAAAQQGLMTKQIENIIGGFDADAVRAKIHGNNADLLKVLNTEQDFLQAQLKRDFVKRRPALRREIENALLGTVNDIDSIQKQAQAKRDKIAADQKRAAQEAAAAVKKREQDLLTSFGLARDVQQNRIAADAAKGNIAAQIKDEQGLRNLVLKQIAAIRERISIEGGRKAAITALRAVLIQITDQTKALVKQQNDAKAQQRADLLSGIGLDISLDQIQQNQNKEIADRRKLIVQLNKDLATEARLHGTTTLRYKEIRNQIAEQNAAIAAITAEKKKQNNALGQAAFEFLQAQQGFASNLLGNLIPGGATAGLVGGGSAPVAAAITPVASAADARSQTGFTAGQGNAVTHVLGQILQVLKQINGAASAPEAARQWQTQRNTMDGVGGG